MVLLVVESPNSQSSGEKRTAAGVFEGTKSENLLPTARWDILILLNYK